MIIPQVQPWLAGDTPDRDMMNAWQAVVDFPLEPPAAWAYQSVGQSIPNNTWTTAVLGAKLRDNDGMWNAGTPTRLTIQTPGWYWIEYNSAWEPTTEVSDRIHRLQVVTPSLTYRANRRDQVSTHTAGVSLSKSVRSVYGTFLNVGDYVELQVFQNSGVPKNTAISLPQLSSGVNVRWMSL